MGPPWNLADSGPPGPPPFLVEGPTAPSLSLTLGGSWEGTGVVAQAGKQACDPGVERNQGVWVDPASGCEFACLVHKQTMGCTSLSTSASRSREKCLVSETFASPGIADEWV